MVCYFFLFWVQNLVFECVICNTKYTKLKNAIEPQRDSVGLYLIGNNT